MAPPEPDTRGRGHLSLANASHSVCVGCSYQNIVAIHQARSALSPTKTVAFGTSEMKLETARTIEILRKNVATLKEEVALIQAKVARLEKIFEANKRNLD